MLSFYPRRYARRPVLIVLILALVVFFAGYLKDVVYDSYHPPRVEMKTVHGQVTVVEIRTAWARATRTVTADRMDSTPAPKPIQAPLQAPGDREQDSTTLVGQEVFPPSEQHIFRPDGLLQVNPAGPHPIFELIKRAEADWEGKVNRASKTLEEAVAEYKRRYYRDPPIGFDDWWAYVEENQVQLPDEYDQIHRDLEPYWGMDPNDLQTIQRDWEAHADSYTVGKDGDTRIDLLNYTLPGNEKVQFDLSGGAFQIMELLEDVEEFIPPFRAVFSPHDNPNLPTDWELKQMALDAAAAGKFIDINNPPEIKLHGWISACDPMSAAWKDPIDWDSPPPPQANKTFIYNHREAMDPCQHPSLLRLHGQYLSHNAGPVPHRTMIPQFSYCSTLLHHDIMPAMPINWVEDVLPRSDDPEWDDKFDERLQWRGSNTGMWHEEKSKWRSSQRSRLIDWASGGLEGNITMLPSRVNEKRRVGEAVTVKKGRYGPALLDVALVGEPLSCAPETCEVLKKIYEYRQPHTVKMQGNFKYILDVDGNGWSSRFKRLITSNSLIFKSTIYPEWFTDRIAPWVHYVPVQVDLSDLFDSLVFFRGDPNGDGAHDDLARKIASAGRHWSQTHWRKQDLTAYMFRLFLEYARVMSPEREAMSYSPWDET